MLSAERHIPVLIHEVLESLGDVKGQLIVDGTFGAGGYSRVFLEKGGNVIALDRDPNAIRDGQAMLDCFPGRLTLIQQQFSRLDDAVCGMVDAVVLDIGVSSMQLDEAERGFSFQKDGPLDMRMAQAGKSAADVVNQMKANDLSRIFHILGEERHAGRIARMIEQKRAQKPFERTLDLANAIEALVGRKPGDHIHPATRVFQALRIYVNNELGELARALFAAERVLKKDGRLAVVTFHSLEDRMVKRFFNARSGKVNASRHLPDRHEQQAVFIPLFKGAKTASEEEISFNPRARSAKLRVGVRTQYPVQKEDMSIFGVPDLAIEDGI